MRFMDHFTLAGLILAAIVFPFIFTIFALIFWPDIVEFSLMTFVIVSAFLIINAY